jgi:hypothetical protein
MDALICGQGVVRSTQEAPLPRHAARQEARELCPAEDRLTGKPVTESNLTPEAPAHVAAVRDYRACLAAWPA